jgi:hypothetical protein
MAAAKLTMDDAAFVELYEAIGPNGIARQFDVAPRNVHQRRAAIEGRTGRKIEAPAIAEHRGPRHRPQPSETFIGRLESTVEDGVVVVGSDAHYWPGHLSPAHQHFVQFIKRTKPEIVVANGDILDGATISRHARIGWEDRPSLVEEVEECKERLAEVEKASKGSELVWTLGNHDCFDPQTECLTRRGWLHYTDIQADDEVLSLHDGKPTWSPILRAIVKDYDGDLVRIEKTRMSMAVTPRHRVLLKRRDWRTNEFDIEEYREADDLPFAFALPCSGQSAARGVTLTDDELRLCGWILTDAGYDANGATIYQSKVEHVQSIRALLERLGLNATESVRERNITHVCGRELLKPPLPAHEWRIPAHQARDIKAKVPDRHALPWWAHELTADQFEVLLGTIIDADGVWDGNVEARSCCVIYGQERFLSSLQAVAVQHGWRARLTVDIRGDLRLCMTRIPSLRCDRKEVFREHYSGPVWCLQVPDENFMVRRNGCAYFSGNCRFETKLANTAPEYAKIHGVHLKDHFPRWAPCWSLMINGNTMIKHRLRNGVHATWNNTLHAGVTIVTGHLHSLQIKPKSDYNGTRWGVDCGTLADPAGPQFADYTEDGPKDWRMGFAVLTYRAGRLLWPELYYVRSDGVGEWRGEEITL